MNITAYVVQFIWEWGKLLKHVDNKMQNEEGSINMKKKDNIIQKMLEKLAVMTYAIQCREV